MKATEFANFFDFTIKRNADSDESKYIVTDNMDTLPSRYIDYVDCLGECFDSLLDDYIVDDLMDMYGFVHDQESDTSLFEQAYIFAKDNNVSYTDILYSLLHPSSIYDDTLEREEEECY